MHGLALKHGKNDMQIRRQIGNRRLPSGPFLGFFVMLALLGLTTWLIFTVRSELDLAKLDDAAAEAAIALQTEARTEAEAQVVSLEQSHAALQTQMEAARVARGVAEEAANRETTIRIAAEQESINQELAKIAAEQEAKKEQQAKIEAEAEAEEQKQAAAAASQEATRQRLAKESAEQQLAAARAQAQKDVAREQSLNQPLLRGIVNGLLTFGTEPLPDYASEGAAEAVQQVAGDLEEWNGQGFNVRPADPQDADLTIGWVRDYGSPPRTVVGEGTRIMVALGATNCLGNWAPFDGETVKRLLWHEIGHAFGYGESTKEDNIMHPELATRFATHQTVELVLAPPSLSQTVPLCGAGTFIYAFEKPTMGGSYQVAVLKPGVKPADYFGEDSQYTGCSSSVNVYTNECIVEEGAVLLVYSQMAIFGVTGTLSKNVVLPEIELAWDPDTLRYSQEALDTLRKLFS